MKILSIQFDKRTAIFALFLCLIIIVMFWYFFHVPKQQEILKLELERKKLIQISDNILKYKNKYGNLDEYMQKIEERYQLASISLPERMQQGEFINFLHQMALENQVKILAMIPSSVQPVFDNPNENLESESEIDENKSNSNPALKMLPINVKIECSYISLINFLKAIEDSERMTQIKNLSIVSRENGEKLNCELNIIIFAFENQN